MDLSVSKVTDALSPAADNIIHAIGAGRRMLLQRMGNAMLRMSRASFGSAGSFRGNRWPPLSKKYAKEAGGSQPTLLRTGKLRDSIKLGQPRGNYIEIYTRSPYGLANFLGTKTLPQRRFLPVEQSGKTMWRFIYQAEREMVNELSKGLTQLSHGTLPRILSVSRRMPYERGNVTTPPTVSS